jgi:hypothetical protein
LPKRKVKNRGVWEGNIEGEKERLKIKDKKHLS